jgi:siroheme synthase (precorrin-2 oxidase/ferrochelatase)
MNDSLDVDLETMFSESGDESTPSASTQKESSQTASEGVTTPEPSERENERVRKLADENAALRASLAERDNAESNGNNRSVAQPTDLESLLESRVQDPGSREVLREMAKMLTRDIESKYAPKLSEVEITSKQTRHQSQVPSRRNSH